MAVFLADLLPKIQLNKALPAIPEIEITGISDNSAKVKPGHIFVAIKGYEFDGHNYIDHAIAQGAVAVIAERDVKADVPIIVVPDSRIALAQLCNFWHGYPAEAMKMIGVTASNGKTTTSFMIDSVLSSHYPMTGLIGTVVVKDGRQTISADLTTPSAHELYEILARMRDNGCSHVTMEVSSAGQELNRVHGVPYSIATFNNVTREHIDFHGSFENYWFHKTKLLKNLAPTSTAVLNADEPLIAGLQNEIQADSITYSLKNNPAHIQIEDIDLSTGAGIFRYRIPQDISSRNFSLPACDHHFHLKVLGLHNIYNAAVAITVGKLCNVPDETIESGLAQFGGVERRFQLIYDGDFKVIDDHFANTGNIDITLTTLGLMKYNKLHLLIAIRGSRGVVVNRENTETVVKWLPKLPFASLVLTDSLECAGVHDIVSPAERETVLNVFDEAGIKYRHYPKLSDAIHSILEAAGAGDVVLMGGCQGLDPGAHIALPFLAQRHSLPEREKILKILEGRVAGSS